MPENFESFGQEDLNEKVHPENPEKAAEQRSVHEGTARSLRSLKALIPAVGVWDGWQESQRAAEESLLIKRLSQFRSENPEDRISAAWMRPDAIPSSLRTKYRPILHELMRGLTEDPNVEVRTEIAKSWFFNKHYPELAPRIHHDPSFEVREACASRFGIFDNWEPELIRDYLHDESPLVRAAMVRRWNPLMPFVKDVVALTHDDSPEVQRAVQDSEAIQYLLGYWKAPLFTPGLG